MSDEGSATSGTSPGRNAARQFQIRFARAYLHRRDPTAAAIEAGVPQGQARQVAARVLTQPSTLQLIETMHASYIYDHDPRYRNASAPILDNIFHCCSQKTASQWFKNIFFDPVFYRATGLRKLQYVALGNRFARLKGTPPVATILTHLYIGYDTYRTIPKPARYKTFYVLRDPRDIVVSWYYSAKISHGLVDPIPRMRKRLRELDFQAGMRFIIDELMDWDLFGCQRSWVEKAHEDPAVRIFRYEGLAADEHAFLRGLFDYLGIPMDEQTFEQLYQRYAFERITKGRKKGQEDQTSHYRSGSSGDWRNKFNAEIYGYFRDKTGDLVECLGYGD